MTSLKTHPLIEDMTSCSYDVMISSMVVESIAHDYGEYKLFISRQGKLVKPGGLLLVENCEFYEVGDFTNFPVSSEMPLVLTILLLTNAHNLSQQRNTEHLYLSKVLTFRFMICYENRYQ